MPLSDLVLAMILAMKGVARGVSQLLISSCLLLDNIEASVRLLTHFRLSAILTILVPFAALLIGQKMD